MLLAVGQEDRADHADHVEDRCVVNDANAHEALLVDPHLVTWEGRVAGAVTLEKTIPPAMAGGLVPYIWIAPHAVQGWVRS